MYPCRLKKKNIWGALQMSGSIKYVQQFIDQITPYCIYSNL